MSGSSGLTTRPSALLILALGASQLLNTVAAIGPWKARAIKNKFRDRQPWSYNNKPGWTLQDIDAMVFFIVLAIIITIGFFIYAIFYMRNSSSPVSVNRGSQPKMMVNEGVERSVPRQKLY